MSNFQIICITCESNYLSLQNLINNWNTKNPLRVVIYANGQALNICDYLNNCEVIKGTFESFSETRNKLIKLTEDFCKYTIFLDDSYYIMGNLNELLVVDNIQCSILVKTGISNNYRRLIFKKGQYYIGKIHEVLNECDDVGVLKNVWILDKLNEEHKLRSLNRVYYDLLMLKDDNSRRGIYYKGCSYIKKYELNNKNRFYLLDAKKIFKKLLKEDDKDYVAENIKKILLYY